MKCPRCNAELSIYVLHDDYDTFCHKCGYFPKKKSLYPEIEAKYCPKVQNGDLSEAEFEEYLCEDCVYDDCVLARSVLDDFGLVQAAAELRYLTLKSCWHGDPVFPAIGRLKHLRGLDLDQMCQEERGYIVFDSAAVKELGKLENLEVLALRNCVAYSKDALAKLGTLKNLKALHLNLLNHKFADKNACVEVLSFLKKLDKLEYLNISTRYPFSPDRLTVRDLELPPSLKYLELEGKVHRFHAVTVKPLVELSMKDGALVCRFKGKEAFLVAGDGTTPESRQQLVAALREMLIHLPPDDGAKIVAHGIAVDFDAPELAKLIETELAIKVAPRA